MTWIQTRDGNAIELLTGEEDIAISIEEVAHCLARIGRFAGHTRTECPYTVAQHSVLVSQHVPPEDALAGLLHDAHEAIIGDITSPVKMALSQSIIGGGSSVKRLDDVIAYRVRKKLGVHPALPASVKRADLEALVTECRDLMGGQCRPWGVEATPWSEPIVWAWHTSVAEREFLQRYRELTGEGEAKEGGRC